MTVGTPMKKPLISNSPSHNDAHGITLFLSYTKLSIISTADCAGA